MSSPSLRTANALPMPLVSYCRHALRSSQCVHSCPQPAVLSLPGETSLPHDLSSIRHSKRELRTRCPTGSSAARSLTLCTRGGVDLGSGPRGAFEVAGKTSGKASGTAAGLAARGTEVGALVLPAAEAFLAPAASCWQKQRAASSQMLGLVPGLVLRFMDGGGSV